MYIYMVCECVCVCVQGYVVTVYLLEHKIFTYKGCLCQVREDTEQVTALKTK